jgi:polysaccharide pyruvyl transferase WcaK-like protein
MMTTDIRKLKILITGIHEHNCFGQLSIMYGLITYLNRYYPSIQYYVFSTSKCDDENNLSRTFSKHCDNIHVIRVISLPKAQWVIKVITMFIQQIFVFPTCALGVHLGTDGFSDTVLPSKLLSKLGVLGHSYQMLLGRLFNKPVAACSMSIGPFNTTITLSAAKFALNKVNLITARESNTVDYLNQIGVRGPVHLVSDLAFLLEPTDVIGLTTLLRELGLNLNRKAVGLVPSQVMAKRKSATQSNGYNVDIYYNTMAYILDYLADNNLEVIVFCQNNSEKYDDRIAIIKILELARYKPKVIDLQNYTIQEIKAILGYCEMVLSCKLHSAILAAGMCVPSVLMTSEISMKIEGIIGTMLQMKDYIIDIASFNLPQDAEHLVARIDRCWQERDKMKSILQQRIPEIQKMATLNIKYLSRLIEAEYRKSNSRIK